MRIAIVADVHANLAALEAVLRHAEAQNALAEVWCLGDMVGYGPDPSATLEVLRRYPLRALVGNHDLAAIGQLSAADFNPDAAATVRWTAEQLTPEDRQYLEQLPLVVTADEFTLVHGTLRGPVWEYLFSYEAAQAHLELQTTPFGLVGHTHVPLLVTEESSAPYGCRLAYIEAGQTIPLGDGQPQLVINPGGVGQPRDGDPHAAYAVYDSDARTVTVHRIDYDIAATQAKMATAGLPRWLIERLRHGR